MIDIKKRAQLWLESDQVSEEDKKIIRSATKEQLVDMFGADIEFGTAGLRGEIGPGTNRLNELVVRKATVGLAHFILDNYKEEGKKRGVAVSFDNRRKSHVFADEVVDILNSFGINTFSFSCPHPTPELSYSVRANHCVAGVMVTASHNPKEYNGYKVYDETGCQMVYENIDKLVKEIKGLPDFLDVKVEHSKERGTNTVLGENFDDKFTTKEADTSVLKNVDHVRHVKIVLTPQCGTNCYVGPWTLRKCGYTVTSVPSQDRWDTEFDGVQYPNPEFDVAWVKAKALLEQLHKEDPEYSIAICNDPDADRVGLGFIGKDGQFHRYTGNQTGALLIDYILGEMKRQGKLPQNGIIYQSFVTSAFGATIATKKYGIQVKYVPTGFKYVGYAIEHTKGHPFLFGYEESYGYLTKEFVRDKDCLQSNVVIADMAEDCARNGMTVDERMAKLESEFGHFVTALKNIYVNGLIGKKNLAKQLNAIRKEPIKEVGGVKVLAFDDYLNSIHHDLVNHTQSKIEDIPSLDCIKYFFENGWLAVRPSGTEPKCKIYCEMVASSEAEGASLAEKVIEDFNTHLKLD